MLFYLFKYIFILKKFLEGLGRWLRDQVLTALAEDLGLVLGTHMSVNSVAGYLTLSSDLHGHQAYMGYIYTYSGKTLYTNKNKSFFETEPIVSRRALNAYSACLHHG